jgi:hypothetical protein
MKNMNKEVKAKNPQAPASVGQVEQPVRPLGVGMTTLTPWFHGREKPARKGVYQQWSGSGALIGYQYWDGRKWYVWAETAAVALARYKHRHFVADDFQHDSWRGLSCPPNVKLTGRPV